MDEDENEYEDVHEDEDVDERENVSGDEVVGLSHEKLDAYRLALDVARWAATLAIPYARRHLRDQLLRAADSVVLNIAEGSGRSQGGDARRNHYYIAAGSAAEVGAVLDLLNTPQCEARKRDIVRIVSMLTRLARR